MSGTPRFDRRRMVRLGLALPLLSAACAGPAQSTDLHDTLEHLCEKNRMPGLAAAVWRGPVRVAAAAAGVRKHNDPTPVTIDDQWHLGSDTKAMTATLVGLFVDRGILRFEDVLDEALSDWRLHPGYAGVSIELLLQHRGGTPPDVPDDLGGLLTDGDPSTARAAVVRAILTRPPAGATGKYSYSNVGYMILGMVLERKGRTSWESLMRTELFTPLRMDSAGFGPRAIPQPSTNRGATPKTSNQCLRQTLAPTIPPPTARQEPCTAHSRTGPNFSVNTSQAPAASKPSSLPPPCPDSTGHPRWRLRGRLDRSHPRVGKRPRPHPRRQQQPLDRRDMVGSQEKPRLRRSNQPRGRHRTRDHGRRDRLACRDLRRRLASGQAETLGAEMISGTPRAHPAWNRRRRHASCPQTNPRPPIRRPQRGRPECP
ncbi:serine hydrolase domain-containing protein [Nocardia terpenica]|uniref:Serine hydrolase n=1 Tax=Nocardia terpenica TaxID=455432 RepID=A0A6G9Z2P1_9NOCA|nr:serine hydrolase [Nocardia terpenica]